MAYVSATGLLNANRSVLVTSQPPTIINGHILTISNKISFGGLTDFEIKTAIAAIIEFQRGAK